MFGRARRHSARLNHARRRSTAWITICLLALSACSAKSSKTALTPSQPSLSSSSSSTTTTPPSTTTSTTTTIPPTTVPPTTTPPTVISVASAGPPVAGQWRPIGLVVNGVPTLTATLLQGSPGAALTGVVRIATAVTRPVLYAGTSEPGGTWPSQGAVASAKRAGLVAAFNGGFHTSSSGGGWFDHGRTAVPLRGGAASLVIHADGSATVGMWGRDATMSANVVSVRQNLSLLVDGGANLGGNGSWGLTLGGVSNTWRSGLGIDAARNLIYAGGPSLDAQTLAQVLIRAGAVRAMELDINPQWVSFSYYNGHGSGSDLIAGMNYSPSHWLSGSARDFFTVFLR